MKKYIPRGLLRWIDKQQRENDSEKKKSPEAFRDELINKQRENNIEKKVSRSLLRPVWGCSPVGRVLDQHATDTGFYSGCSKGFFFHSQLSVQTLLQCPYPAPSVQSHALSFVHMLKSMQSTSDWIMETLKHLACTVS